MVLLLVLAMGCRRNRSTKNPQAQKDTTQDTANNKHSPKKKPKPVKGNKDNRKKGAQKKKDSESGENKEKPKHHPGDPPEVTSDAHSNDEGYTTDQESPTLPLPSDPKERQQKPTSPGQGTSRPKSKAVAGHTETTASQEQPPKQQSTASQDVMDKTIKFLADWNEIGKVGRNAAPSVRAAFPNTKAPLHRRGKEVWNAIKKSLKLEDTDAEKIDELIKAATALAEKGRKAEPVEEASKKSLASQAVNLATSSDDVKEAISKAKKILQGKKSHLSKSETHKNNQSFQISAVTAEKMIAYLALLERFIISMEAYRAN